MAKRSKWERFKRFFGFYISYEAEVLGEPVMTKEGWSYKMKLLATQHFYFGLMLWKKPIKEKEDENLH
jgi:hypothetical protein